MPRFPPASSACPAARALRVLGLSAVLAWTTPGTAGEWDFTPRLSLEETYTDNVLLRERGAEGDFVSALTPGLSVRGIGPRLTSSIDYNLQQLLYGDKTELDGINHQLQAVNEALLVKDWLYFDVNSRMSQQAINNHGAFTRNNRNGNQNRRDVLSYEWSPRIEHRFGPWFDMRARYFDQTVEQSGSGNAVNAFLANGDSREDGYQVDLSSGPRFGRFPLRLSSESRTSDFDSGRVNKIKRHSIEASYIWSRAFRSTVSGGLDDNSFTSGRGANDGPSWSVGGTWTPTPRTTVTGNWGNRFFGKTYNVKADHRVRRWNFNLAYSEEVRTTNQFERDLVLVPLLGVDGLPVFDPVTSGQIFVPIDSPTLTDDVFVQEQLRVGLNYAGRRTNGNLSFFDIQRLFQSNGTSESTRGVALNLQRRIRPHLSVSLGGSWRENEFSGDRSSGSFYSLYPSLSYELGPHTTARLQYEYTRNAGATGGLGGGLGGGGLGFRGGGGVGGLGGQLPSDYVENAVSANLVFHL